MIEYLNVEVTAEDIAAGVVGDCLECPLALAVKRAAHNSRAWAGPLDIYDGLGFYKTNSEARDLIADFDRGRQVSPQTFSFEKR